jgi:hypothetical protein
VCILNGQEYSEQNVNSNTRILFTYKLLKWDKVDIVTRLRAVRRKRRLCLLESVPTGSGLHPGLC